MIDAEHKTWKFVKAWADKVMDASRASLEAPGLSAVETEYHRGRISAIKELLALAEPKKNKKNILTSNIEY